MISTIGQLLDAMNVELQVFDLGRQVQAISRTTFQQFETQDIAYPSPHMGHAWLGIVFWAPEAPEQPVLWFVKLPLDEQGKLAQAERDRFLQQLLTGAGKNLQAAKQGTAFQEVLKDNPFIFSPPPEKQAFINSKVRQQLELPPSQYQDAALKYLNGDLTQWQELPLQGVADIVCHWKSNRDLLASSLGKLPEQPLILLCQLLENEPVDDGISTPLLQRLSDIMARANNLSPGDTAIAIALLRGLSQSINMQDRQKALRLSLESSLRDSAEFLATVASRNHLELFDDTLCLEYLAAMAEHDQAVFDTLLQQLLFTPIMRKQLLKCIQLPQCPDRVRKAFQTFANSVRGTLH